MTKGSCLCGSVSFEISGPIHEIVCCHCSRCRKAYGSAFGAVAAVDAKDIGYTNGEEHICTYQQFENANRYFCGRCGSPLPIIEPWDPLAGVPAGLIDDEIEAPPTYHIFVGSKAAWWDICDSLEKHETWRPGADMKERRRDLTRR